MNAHDNPIYRATLDAMQAADEIGGCDNAADYIELMQAIAAECGRRAETARINQVIDMLYDACGAILCWQVPDALAETFENAHNRDEIGFDIETDCYLHPDAVRNPDGEGYYIPHQFTR
jgi:hypothetical protein